MKTVFLLLLLLPINAWAWYDAGHMASSWITWQQLTPAAKRKVQEYLSVLKEAEPETEDFLVASTWLDNIKNSGLSVTRYWHTVSQEQAVHGLAKGPEKQNGVWVVQEAITTLENPKASRFAKAFMLRALIHVVQDLHQPLHVCDDSMNRKPEAANCYKAFGIKPVHDGSQPLTNLHQLWDAAVGSSPMVRYNDQSTPEKIEHYSKALLSRVDTNILPPLAARDPMIWVKESEKLLNTFAVRGITPGEALSEEYLTKGKAIAEERLVTAAFRLASLLNQVFSQP